MIHIDLNALQSQPKLPFIYLPKLDLKILIDSGASNSIINPKQAYEKFSQYLYKRPFSVSGLGGTFTAEDNIDIPILQELGLQGNVKLHVMDWNTRFDALLGSEDLKMFNAVINYKKNHVEIGKRKIPFMFEYTSAKIPPNTMLAVNYLEVPVTIEAGEVVFPEIQINNISIPECLTVARNGRCFIPLDREINSQIEISERIPVVPLFQSEISNPPKIRSSIDTSKMLRINHLNPEERDAIMELCRRYRDIFYNEGDDLSFTNAVKHRIKTVDEEPVYARSYRHPHAMNEEIQRQVQKLLDNKIIRPSISPYCAPVWLVPKKMDASGKKKYRMVIDYRKLNAKTIEDRYPTPRIDLILDNLGKCTYYSTLDLAQGYYQIEMDPGSIEKTAFAVNNGFYEMLRMPMGLKNSPSTFMRVMDNIFRDYLYKFCFIYMDDLVCFSKSLDEHLQHLQLIFKKLREFNLKIQPDKSEFLRKEVAFLGHVITPHGVKPNPDKIAAVTKFPIPKTPKQIKSFLGFVGYYRKFISDFAKVTAPMVKYLRANSVVNVEDPEYREAFNSCKELLTNAPILAYPDFGKPFTLTTDSSNVALGGVLSQSDKPISYYSRILNPAERNYSTIEKELLAILACVRNFRPYLYGQKFTIETDHNPLVWLAKIKEPNSRLIRWKLKLEEFDFVIKYKKGKENRVADALSRVEIHNNEVDTDIRTPQPLDIDEIIQGNDNNPGYQEVLQDLTQSLEVQRASPEMDPPLTIPEELSPHTENEPCSPQDHDPGNDSPAPGPSMENEQDMEIPTTKSSVNTFSNRVILRLGDSNKRRIMRPFGRNTHIVTIKPEQMTETLTEAIRDIFAPNRTYGIFISNREIKDPFIELFKSTCRYKVNVFICDLYCQDVTDREVQNALIEEYHNANHNGITETINHFRKTHFWPNLRQTISDVINVCESCLQSKYERHPYNLKFQGPLLAKRPFDVVHIDTFSFQGSKFLTTIDLFTRYAQAYHIKDGTGLTILNTLRHYLAHHNIPQRIVCDEGKEFKNKTFEEFCKFHKIQLHYTTVNNPNSNSPVERLHSTLIEKLRILQIKNPKELPMNLMISAIIIYNQSIHSSTGYPPFELLYGPYERLIETDMDMTIFENYNQKRKQELCPFYDQIYAKNKNRAEKTLETRNKDKESCPELGDRDVYVERNRPGKLDPPFERIRVTAQSDAKIQGLTEKARKTTANVRKVKRLRVVSSPLQEAVTSPNFRDPDPGSSSDQD